MKHVLIIVMALQACLMVQAQNKDCKLNVYASKVDGQVVLEYYVGANEGKLDLEGQSEKWMGMIGSTQKNLDDKKIMTYYYCYKVPDSTHFRAPGAQLISNGKVTCEVEGYWVAVDTFNWKYVEEDGLIAGVTQKFNCEPTKTETYARFPEFTWLDGVEPEVTVTVSKKGVVGDTLHLTISSNFPVKEITSRMRLVNLKLGMTKGSTVKTTRKEKVIDSWFYSETFVVTPTFAGQASFEALEFEYLGKKISIPSTKIKVKK